MLRMLACLLMLTAPSLAAAQTKWQVTDVNGKPLVARIGGIVVIPKAAEPPVSSGDLSAMNNIDATTEDMVEIDAVEADGKTPVKGNVEWVVLPLGHKYRPYQGADGSSHAILQTPPKGGVITVMAFGGNDKGAIRLGTTKVTYKIVPNGPPNVGPDVTPVDPNVRPVDPPPPVVVVVPTYAPVLMNVLKADFGSGSTKDHMEALAKAYTELGAPTDGPDSGWKNAGEFYGAMTTLYEKMGFTPTAPPLKATRTALRELILSEMEPFKTATFGMEQRRFLRTYCNDIAKAIRYVAANLDKPIVVPVDPVTTDVLTAPYFVLVVTDQEAMTVEAAKIRMSPTLRTWLDGKQLKALFIDKRNLDSFPEINSIASSKTLPLLIVQGHKDGKLVNKDYPLPKTEQEVIDQITKHIK